MNYTEAQSRVIESSREAVDLQRAFSRAASELQQVIGRAAEMQADAEALADALAAEASESEAWTRVAAEADQVRQDITRLSDGIAQTITIRGERRET